MLPVPPFVEVTAPLVLDIVPALVAVTLTVTTQDAPPAIVAPEKLNVDTPPAGANVGEPQFEVLAAGVAATCNPVGNVSVNATPVNAVLAFEFVIVKVNVVTSFTVMGSGENDFVIDGGASTVNVLVAVLPVPPFVEDTLPLVLIFIPDVVAVMFTETVHDPDARIVPPEKLRV